jgi:DNA invertase Pin-like site-specific DNA recombinase
MVKIVGYARVSTREQNLERQLQALKQYVADDMIVTDKASGKDFNRKGYQSLKVGIGKLSKGDTLYIKSLDRLSRNKEQAKDELKYFQSIGVRVKVIDLPTTMADIPKGQEWVLEMINNILIEVLTTIAENERITIRQRQAEGMAVMPIGADGKRHSLKTGRAVGRPKAEYPTNWEEVYTQWQNKEITAKKAMELLNLKRNTFYKLANEYNK